ncbi:MAG: BamA/TamA family outer membrane protein [bacterium]|nr:BamA/TamA family outer membrane protein [bacterium]
MMKSILAVLIILCFVSSTKADEVGRADSPPVSGETEPRAPSPESRINDLERVCGTIERIELQGSTKIREGFIRREITLNPGEKFNLEQAIESKNNILRNLKYIEQVNLYIEPGSEAGKLIVIFELEETRAKFSTLSAGYSDEEKFFGTLQIWYDNFLHRGMKLGIELKEGDKVDCKSLTIYEPWLFHTPHSFKFKIYSDEYERIQSPYEGKGDYWIDRDGTILEFGRRAIFKNITLALRYRDENIQLSDLEDVSSEITSTKKDADINSISCRLDLDTRKFQQIEGKYELAFEDYETSWLNPIDGWKYELSVEAVNDLFGADYNFNKWRLNLNQYLKLDGRQVLALSGKGGYIAGDAPFYERFYVGGGDTIRGYKERGLTDTGGNKLLVLTTEYRLGLTKSVQGVLFADAGYAWGKGTKVNLDDLEYGVGTGFRIYHSLIGGLNINFGYGIDKKDWEIHITTANTGE